MIPPSFEYYSAESVPHALSLLGEHGEDAKVLAGGMSLIPLLKLRLAAPGALIDINRIDGLSYIRKGTEGGLEIGALTRYTDIEDAALIKQEYPALHEASSLVADIHIRNLGTIGGSVAHADPALDVPTVLLALGARVHVAGNTGERVYDLDDFFVDSFTTQLAHDELVTGITIPKPAARTGTAYLKFSRRSGDFAIVGVAAALTFSEDGQCSAARIALEAAGPTLLRARAAESGLVASRHLSRDSVEAAASEAAHECEPVSDLYGSEAYKREMVRVYTKRAILTAMSRVDGVA